MPTPTFYCRATVDKVAAGGITILEELATVTTEKLADVTVFIDQSLKNCISDSNVSDLIGSNIQSGKKDGIILGNEVSTDFQPH